MTWTDEKEKQEFENLMKSSGHDYWILDGAERAYDLKEEIKAWGGYWVPNHKSWRIDNLEKTDHAYLILKKAGLTLQVRI